MFKSRVIACALIVSATTNSGQAGVSRDELFRRPENIRLAQALARCNALPPVQVKPIIILRKTEIVPAKLDINIDARFAGIYRQIEKEAARAGVSPIVMFAIMRHETGNFSSHLWRCAYNPGGIKYRHPYGRCGVFSSFSSPEDGIRAEADVLLHARYDGARRTTDPYRQAEAIGDAGYAEYSSSWLLCVRNHIARLGGKEVYAGLAAKSRFAKPSLMAKLHRRRRHRYFAD